MSRVSVRSEALAAVAARLTEAAELLREDAALLAAAVQRCRSPDLIRRPGLLGSWLRVEADGVRLTGPTGLWGAALGLEVLAARLSVTARAYVEVERAVTAVLDGVHRGAVTAARAGLLTDGPRGVDVRPVPVDRAVPSPAGPADLVALGEGLDGGRVRVVELDDGAGGSAWVVAVPGTQQWSPRAGDNPFDATSDVRAVTGDATLAAAGVVAALDRARAASGRARPDDPVLLVGHSQGGIHAAALAADPGFTRTHHVTHVLTTGAPVGVFAVPETVRVLSVEHADDPVPTLDLTPNPATPSWLTVRAGAGPPVDVRRHALSGYERTVRAAEDAPAGAVPGLAAWEVSAAAFLHRPVRGVTEVAVTRSAGGAARLGRVRPSGVRAPP
ncbi:alpha/beta hydrolase family protein [Phycicoccus flavus]|uniref:PGAP1-like protein n=1 Tax=Phycicoccus flavus TaxID=2502783 RepID=A0A8T6R784_9MICO|nr:hypothetical protein [Phycicoccus flavus]NHA68101.1 hypothetical protein [Phycicoccus flavus]